MNKKTKRTIVIAVAAVLLIAAAVIIFIVVNANSAGYRSISIAEIYGKVITQNGGKTYEAYKNMRLADGYELTTDPDSYTRMVLDDDKYVKLEQESHAIFEALGDSKKHLTTICLEKGALTTEITKPLNESESYVVNTPNAVLAVRGTMFRVEVKQDKNGDFYCDVYTYGGIVEAHRIMPDGTHVDERVEIRSGYKATIKMDEVITVYLEEKIDEATDNVDPINIPDIIDSTLVDIYNSSYHGHGMFITTSGLWDEILRRGIDLSEYKSVYDGKDIPKLGYGYDETSSAVSTSNNSENSIEKTDSVVSSYEISDNSSDSSETTSNNVSESENSGGSVIIPPNSSEDNNNHIPDTSSAQNSGSSPDTSVSKPENSSESVSSAPESTSVPESSSGSPESSSASNSSETPAVPPSPAHTHTLATTTTEPTCTQSGSKIVKCEVCGETVSEETLPPRGHISVTETVIPATCTDEGEEIDRCSVCNGQLGRRTIPALGHTEVTSTVSATCTESGKTIVKCNVCNELLNETVIDALGHDYEDKITKPASCTEDGAKVEVCTRCDEERPGSLTVIEKLPHTEITEEEDGIRTVTCAVCGELISEINIATGIAYPFALDDENVFPDEEFRATVKLTVSKYDTDGDGMLSLEECKSIKVLNRSSNAKSLNGIEMFINLETLRLTNMIINEVDLSHNSKLKVVYLHGSTIGNLNINNNPELEDLTTGICYNIIIGENISLKSLNLSNDHYANYTDISQDILINFPSLENLSWCYAGLTSLDLSHNNNLTFVNCINNKLAYLDVSCCSNLTELRATDNRHPIHVENGVFDLASIEGFDVGRISDLQGATLSGTVLSGIAEGVNITYTYDCKGTGESAYQAEFTLVPDENSTFAPETPEGVEINAENFPDEVFRQYVSENFDDGDGMLTQEECDAVTKIDVERRLFLTTLKGIEYFTKLEELWCGRTALTELDISKNIALKWVDCSNTQIASLDISKNTALLHLDCSNTPLTELDVSNNNALTVLLCYDTKIASLNVNNSTELISLNCRNTQITSLDVSNNTKLQSLGCANTLINSLDISNNTDLWQFYCSNTLLTSLDISNNIALQYFDCSSCKLAFIILNSAANIPPSGFAIDGNEYPIHVEDGVFDLKSIDGFDISRIVGTVEGMDENGVISGITEGTNITYTYDCKGTGESAYQAEFTLVPDESSTFAPETPEGVAIDETNFPNEKFRQYVSENFDTDGDGELSQEECDKVTVIYANGTSSTDGGITSLNGIENFSKLRELRCYCNSGLTEIDVSKNAALMTLSCNNTQITSLDVSNNTKLESLTCYNTQITSLNISENTALKYLHCYNTQITLLDLSNNTELENVSCHKTPIASLTVNSNPKLTRLSCGETLITSLDVSNDSALTELLCYNTQITALDVSKNTALAKLSCFNNILLETLDCSSTKITEINLIGCTTLTTLYCNDTQITSLDVWRSTALTDLSCYNTQITSLDLSKNTALEKLNCRECQLPFVDLSNCPNITTLDTEANKYPIHVENGEFDLKTIPGINPSKVHNLTKASWKDRENGIITGITKAGVAYTYDCGNGHNLEIFMLQPDESSTSETVTLSEESTSDENDDNNFTALPLDDTDTTPPSSADTGADATIPVDAALPPKDVDDLRLLLAVRLIPLGILALMRDRKRKTAFRVRRKAEI